MNCHTFLLCLLLVESLLLPGCGNVSCANGKSDLDSQPAVTNGPRTLENASPRASPTTPVGTTASQRSLVSSEIKDASNSSFRSSSVVVNDDANWPGFRGPQGVGVSDDANLPVEWSESKNILWKQPLPGPGASSPITWTDRVYVTCYSGYGTNAEAPGDPANLKRHLLCVSATDGRVLWERTLHASGYEKPYKDLGIMLHGYASNTPAADATGVYVYYGPSGAARYSHKGELLWQSSCGESSHVWGTSPSVVLSARLMILNAANESDSLLALDKESGAEVWRVEGFPSAFHTPLLLRNGERQDLLVAHENGHLSGVDPATGARRWTCRMFDDYINTMPIADDGMIYVAGRNHLTALRSGGDGDVTSTHQLWTVNSGSYVSSPVFHRGRIYWARDDGGIIFCADARTGELLFEQRLEPTPSNGRIYASPLAANGRIYFVTRECGTYVIAAEPEYRLLAYNVIADDRSVFNGSPAVHRGRILIRSDRFLYCIGTN